MKIDISIIIPIYNAEQYLGRCLDSLLHPGDGDEREGAQGEGTGEGPGCEIILVDDGSTDGSPSICDRYGDLDSRIKVIHQRNQGVGAARNTGIRNASGSWLCFVDADDFVVQKEFLHGAGLVKKPETGQGPDVVIFSRSLNDIPPYDFLPNDNPQNEFLREELLASTLGYGNHPTFNKAYLNYVFSKFYCRSFLFEKGILFKEDLINGEDMLFNFEAFKGAGRIQCIQVSFYRYRSVMGSSTNTFNPAIIHTDIRFHQYLKELLGLYSAAGSDTGIWQDCYERSLLDGIHACFYRSAFSKDSIGQRLKLLEGLLKMKEYKGALVDFHRHEGHYPTDKRIFFRLCKDGRYKTALAIMTLRVRIKKKIYGLKKGKSIIRGV